MTPEVAIQKREQMIEEGFCVVDDVLTEAFIQELHDESERLIAGHVEPEDVIYQGQHVNVRGEDNTHIQKLLEWQSSRDALEQIGFGDFVSSGGIIILTKESGGPPLYWHQDWMRWNDPLSCAPWPQTIFLNYYLTDTNRENGCLKVIPGTHMFSDHPDQVDIVSVSIYTTYWCQHMSRGRGLLMKIIPSCSVITRIKWISVQKRVRW